MSSSAAGTSKRPRDASPVVNANAKAKASRPNSDDDFLTEDDEVNKRIEARQLRKQQNIECFMSGLKDFGITKTMERAAG